MTKIFFQVAGFLWLSLITCSSYAQEVLTLEDAIRIGLQNNYDILIAENDKKVLSNNSGFAKYSFLPSVDANATRNFDVENFEQQFLDGEPRSGNNAKSNQLSAAIDLEWTIFDGLGMFITYDKLQEISKFGEFNLKATIETGIAEISRSYYQIILEQERINVLKNTLELSEKRREIAKAIFEVGRSSKLEYLAAQVDYNADLSALVAQEELLFNAKVDLNRILGRDVESDFLVDDRIQANEDLKLEELRQSLLEKNPTLIATNLSRKVAEFEKREIRAERFPEVGLYAGYGYNRVEAQSGFLRSNISDGYYYGVNASINIFNGLDIRRRAQNAKINEENTRITYSQLQTDLLANLQNTFIAYKNSQRLVMLESENFKIAQESEAIAYDRYKLGNANFLELREAQRNAVEAESRLLNAEFNTKMAEIELLRLSGRLLERGTE